MSVNLICVVKLFGVNGCNIFWYVVLFGVLFSILVGFVIGMGVVWFLFLVGEIISG